MDLTKEQLIIPIYVNEKIILDMLAIIEDGFSKVSQVNSYEGNNNSTDEKGAVEATGSLLERFFKIELNGEINGSQKKEENQSISKEKVHTNTSLLSKFRITLQNEELLDASEQISNMKVGSFIEIEGELQKNPLIDYMDKFLDMFHMADIFSNSQSQKDSTANKKKNQQTVKQITDFRNELKNSGTIDFILKNNNGKVVLSAQEQYLANENISEILGGRFKVLGKIISVCKNSNESIDLLRKTTLSILNEETLNRMFASFNEQLKDICNLPQFVTKIEGPATLIIPIAIYA